MVCFALCDILMCSLTHFCLMHVVPCCASHMQVEGHRMRGCFDLGQAYASIYWDGAPPSVFACLRNEVRCWLCQGPVNSMVWKRAPLLICMLSLLQQHSAEQSLHVQARIVCRAEGQERIVHSLK